MASFKYHYPAFIDAPNTALRDPFPKSRSVAISMKAKPEYYGQLPVYEANIQYAQ